MDDEYKGELMPEWDWKQSGGFSALLYTLRLPSCAGGRLKGLDWVTRQQVIVERLEKDTLVQF